MRKVIVTEFVTLDGVMHAPHEWSFGFWSDEIGAYKHQEVFASDALLLGRTTYEGFAEAWPGRTDEAGFADRINGMEKLLVSTTVKPGEAPWNNTTVLQGDIPAAIREHKEREGQDILINGSAELIRRLAPHGVIDEYRMLVYPIVLGKGQKLFPDGFDSRGLRLTHTQAFPTGVVALHYEDTGQGVPESPYPYSD
jgi:dihydrofolate reductase